MAALSLPQDGKNEEVCCCGICKPERLSANLRGMAAARLWPFLAQTIAQCYLNMTAHLFCGTLRQAQSFAASRATLAKFTLSPLARMGAPRSLAGQITA